MYIYKYEKMFVLLDSYITLYRGVGEGKSGSQNTWVHLGRPDTEQFWSYSPFDQNFLLKSTSSLCNLTVTLWYFRSAESNNLVFRAIWLSYFVYLKHSGCSSFFTYVYLILIDPTEYEYSITFIYCLIINILEK